jgi:hypothetical protein
MEYKGFNISDTETLLLYDILQELKEIRLELAELKKPVGKTQEAIPEVKPDAEIKPVEVTERQDNKPIEVKEVKPKATTKKPAKKRKPAKKGKVK